MFSPSGCEREGADTARSQADGEHWHQHSTEVEDEGEQGRWGMSRKIVAATLVYLDRLSLSLLQNGVQALLVIVQTFYNSSIWIVAVVRSDKLAELKYHNQNLHQNIIQQ